MRAVGMVSKGIPSGCLDAATDRSSDATLKAISRRVRLPSSAEMVFGAHCASVRGVDMTTPENGGVGSPPRRPGMHDVARLAGVSHQTRTSHKLHGGDA